MKISEEKKTELYAAIHEPIMQLRIKVQVQSRSIPVHKIDDSLYKLNGEIWKEVIKVLNINDGQ